MNQDRCERRMIHQDWVEEAREILPNAHVIKQMVDMLKAIADPGRLQILMALNVREMCVCDLAALLGVSESAASHQMRLLRHMNLVQNRREGQMLYYRLIDEHVMEMIEVAENHVAELAVSE
ncbi:MAG: ArsR family transcriptional regulator [Desulfobulbaceae bacterium]|nr:MAG: ArsR family transcriptional regulator [Desulfobulbaceae bacterium]